MVDTRMDEADVVCGASWGEQSPDRVNRRNGHRTRRWDTRVGSVELRIPKQHPRSGHGGQNAAVLVERVGPGRGQAAQVLGVGARWTAVGTRWHDLGQVGCGHEASVEPLSPAAGPYVGCIVLADHTGS